MMWCDAAGDTIKGCVGEWQLSGDGSLESSIGNSLRKDIFAGLLKHTGSQVADHDLANKRRDCQRRMPAPCCDIQGFLLGIPLSYFDESLEIIPSLMGE